MPRHLFSEGPAVPVETASTSVNIRASGVTEISTTATKVYNIDAPIPGVQKRIIQTGGSTSLKITTGGTSVGTFNGLGHILTFDALHDTIVLEGLSTTRWAIWTTVGTVAAATV